MTRGLPPELAAGSDDSAANPCPCKVSMLGKKTRRASRGTLYRGPYKINVLQRVQTPDLVMRAIVFPGAHPLWNNMLYIEPGMVLFQRSETNHEISRSKFPGAQRQCFVAAALTIRLPQGLLCRAYSGGN